MALFAGRMNDPHVCESHGPGVLPDGERSVRINGQPSVRVGDAFQCGGCPNRVQTGASTVTFGGEFAARLTDKSDHGGRIVLGSTNVVIGGLAGMGSVGAAKSTCIAMAAGRQSGKTSQSYGNCVLESVRQIIRKATSNEVTEDEMMTHALRMPEVNNQPGTPGHGGTNGDVGRQILEDFGIPAERMPADGPATLATVKQAVTERRGVVAFVDPHEISPALYPPACHAIIVTGVELDEHGNVTAVFINDTGAGECGKRVPASHFSSAMRNLPTHKDVGGTSLLVTKGAVW